MKTFLLVLLFLFPGFLSAQKVIVLSVNQPPEFGFSVEKTDTTIVRGASVELGTGIAVFGGEGEYFYRWEPAETLSDSTILNPVATPADTTSYLLTVTDENGCSFSVAYTVNMRENAVSTPLVPILKNLQAVLYPNPNDGDFKVKLTGESSEKIELAIIDAGGKIIKRHEIGNFTGEHTETLQLKLVSGIYSLKIESRKEVLIHQFIIN